MPVTEMITKDEAVNAYVIEHGLITGYVEPRVALLQREGTSSGQPAIMLVVEVEGKKVLVKTSLPMLEIITSTMRAASGVAKPP
jgi:hypothetical protein